MKCWDKEEKATQLQQKKKKLEEKNQKSLAKKKNERLKKYRNSTKQCRLQKTFQNNERKYYLQVTVKRLKQPKNCLGAKYGNGKIIIKKPN